MIKTKKSNLHYYTVCLVVMNLQEKFTSKYCMVGFICKVLICANYVRSYRIAEFNSTASYTFVFYEVSDLNLHILQCAPMSLFKNFKRVDISSLQPDLKGPLSDRLPTTLIAEANKEV